jgi:hypothetical protein
MEDEVASLLEEGYWAVKNGGKHRLSRIKPEWDIEGWVEQFEAAAERCGALHNVGDACRWSSTAAELRRWQAE